MLVLAWASGAGAQYSNDFRYDPNRTHPTEVLQDLQRLSPEKRVDTAMYLFLGVSDTGPRVAAQILLAEKPEYVVDKIVQALAYDPLFQDENRRRYALTVLAAKQEWPNPMTYEILVDGLLDSRVENVCRLALENVPEPRQADAALAMANRLELWYINHPPAAGVLLELIGSYGGAAVSAAPMVERVFMAKDNPWPQNRALAGKTLAQLGGLTMAVDKYHYMDTVQYSGALDGLAYLALLSPSPYEPQLAATVSARTLVIDALAVPSTTVVNKALILLPYVFGGSVYEAGKIPVSLNPQVKSGLIAAAEKQTDPARRDMLVTSLREYESTRSQRGD